MKKLRLLPNVIESKKKYLGVFKKINVIRRQRTGDTFFFQTIVKIYSCELVIRTLFDDDITKRAYIAKVETVKLLRRLIKILYVTYTHMYSIFLGSSNLCANPSSSLQCRLL